MSAEERRESIAAAIARCDRELEEIDQRSDRDTVPAYLVAMGRGDWEHEKRILEWLAGETTDAQAPFFGSPVLSSEKASGSAGTG